MGDPRDPYCAACINKINYLRGKYSYAFWANPFEFFVDGPKVNFGSDFGLMPSLFEPGGIVQHEFFIAGTPVIAFRTGGLKDTVFEFQWDNNSGNGFTFDYYTPGDLINAIDRSLHLFRNKEKFEICRKNAFNSAIDVADVSRAWCKEFYRLKGKIFFNTKEVLDNSEIKDKSEIEKTVNILNNLKEEDMKNYVFKKEETEEFASHQQANKKLPKINFAPQSVIMACSRFYSYIAIRPLLWLRTIRGSVREQFRLRGDLIGQMTSNSCHAPSIALFSFIVVCLHVLIAK
jgi:starch synthase